MRKVALLVLMGMLMLGMRSPALAQDTLSFAYWDESQQPAMQALADEFERSRPDAGVELRLIPWDSYFQRLSTQAMNGTLPDVFWVHSSQAASLVSAGVLMDLGALQVDYDNFPAGLAQQYTYNGVHYAVPKEYDAVALVYNKELFDAISEPYPDATWDWNRLREAAMRLTEPDNGIYGFAAPNEAQNGYYNLIYQNGGYVFQDGTSGFELPETREAVRIWVDLTMVDGVSPPIQTFEEAGADERFIGGEFAMRLAGAKSIAVFDQSPLKGSFGVAVLPELKRRASIFDGVGYAIAADTGQSELALAFVGFLGSRLANEIQAERRAGIPAYLGTEELYFEQFPGLNVQCIFDMAQYAVQMPEPPMRRAWADDERSILESIYQRQHTLEEGLDMLHEIITLAEQ